MKGGPKGRPGSLTPMGAPFEASGSQLCFDAFDERTYG